MLDDLNKLVRMIEENSTLANQVQTETLADISFEDTIYPIISYSIGSKNPTHPVLFITGGVHGLERIGAQLAWSLLKTTLDRLVWDRSLQALFQNIRLVVVPLVNPVGYYKFRRSNGNGVDLMRNSPIKAIDKTPFFLGGQRFSKLFPWYQGEENNLEAENKALYSKFISSAGKSVCVISIDFHSGFGMKDRIWFPYSYTRKPFERLMELNSLMNLFKSVHPYHIYTIEPQTDAYLLNGDIWDYFFLEMQQINPNAVYLPFTLEMGSWAWVRKNPAQIFSKQGIFNPTKEHRLKRTYRRHHLLYDFMLRALYSHEAWTKK